VLVYADQTNRSFVRYGGNYVPALDDMPGDLELFEFDLPDVKDWETAVVRVSEVFGHAVSRLLNAGNLAMLASKVQESVASLKGDCESLPDRLQLILKNLGVSESEIDKADRVKTAKATRKLLVDCTGKEATALVGVIAAARMETSGTAMGRSLKSASSILECLRNTKWDLFSGIAHLGDERKMQADLLLQDVRSALSTDELALAGGLAAKLSEAESRAIRLLTPPKPPVVPGPTPPVTPPPIAPPPEPPKKGLKQVGSGSRSRLGHRESLSEAQELVQKLQQNPKLRLTIHWTLEEEG
jgi:hypothetical protein